ncbi:hypothetical protein [Vibrio parahaemolyticus]|uniref:hypothetical protein n=1 Tax=Vibrio parahaemolyticus TaxID=670 RepID=UPI0011213B32|nr:hypothetical protein [Vibrio parahaemolyticus]EJG0043546.1 hypothetical protein [Vibrio parahaemolyticus]EJO4008814.1 hypothetical protein [Vibrio parahaemolyticus]TOA00157.1 hypothetical protein CGK35_20915 [Vibrio parahaemolyticus]
MEFSAFSEIIKEAAVSPLGVISLCCLLFAFLAIKFFHDVNQYIRLFVFLVLFGGFCGLFLLSTYNVQPVIETASAETNSIELPSVEPEPTPDPAPVTRTVTERVDCGEHWTGWKEVGAGIGSPCPSGCYRGAELGQSYRSVGFPPRPQVKKKFQCWRDEQRTIVVE